MVKRVRSESRKNQLYGRWLNPNGMKMGNQQPRPEEGKVQRLFRNVEVPRK